MPKQPQKRCATCKVTKPLTDFTKLTRSPDGYRGTCKVCSRKQDRRYDAKRREENIIHHTLNYMLKGARIRAKERGVPFDLDRAYLESIVTEKCPVFGIPLDWKKQERSTDTAPSLDRFYPEKGYVKGNVFIISTYANTIKNRGDIVEHLNVVLWMIRTAALLNPTVQWQITTKSEISRIDTESES